MITEDQFNSIQVGNKIQFADDVYPRALRGTTAVVISKECGYVRTQNPTDKGTHGSPLCVYPYHIVNVFVGYNDDVDCDGGVLV